MEYATSDFPVWQQIELRAASELIFMTGVCPLNNDEIFIHGRHKTLSVFNVNSN